MGQSSTGQSPPGSARISSGPEGAAGSLAAIPRGRLALILLLDQFTRNAWRGSARAYRYDARAVALCREGLERGADRALAPLEREFFYMPLLHSERLNDQRPGLACLKRLLAEAPSALAATFPPVARHRSALSHDHLLVRTVSPPERDVGPPIDVFRAAVSRHSRDAAARRRLLAQLAFRGRD